MTKESFTYENCVTSLRNFEAKNEHLLHGIEHDIFFVNPGNPVSFSIEPCNFHVIFFQY